MLLVAICHRVPDLHEVVQGPVTRDSALQMGPGDRVLEF